VCICLCVCVCACINANLFVCASVFACMHVCVPVVMLACVCVSAEYCACTGVQTRLPAVAMRIRTKSKTSNARIVPRTHSPPSEIEGETESVLQKLHMRLKSR